MLPPPNCFPSFFVCLFVVVSGVFFILVERSPRSGKGNNNTHNLLNLCGHLNPPLPTAAFPFPLFGTKRFLYVRRPLGPARVYREEERWVSNVRKTRTQPNLSDSRYYATLHKAWSGGGDWTCLSARRRREEEGEEEEGKTEFPDFGDKVDRASKHHGGY